MNVNKLVNGVVVVLMVASMLSCAYIYVTMDDNLRYTDTGTVVTK